MVNVQSCKLMTSLPVHNTKSRIMTASKQSRPVTASIGKRHDVDCSDNIGFCGAGSVYGGRHVERRWRNRCYAYGGYSWGYIPDYCPCSSPMTHQVTCPYCDKPAKLVTGKDIYPHRKDLHAKHLYSCPDCKAYVGCHGEGTKPLGRLANADLRKAKSKAHSYFDPLWKAKIKKNNVSKREARSSGYKWLARQLNIAIQDCHIGMFNDDQCKKVVDVCAPYRKSR